MQKGRSLQQPAFLFRIIYTDVGVVWAAQGTSRQATRLKKKNWSSAQSLPPGHFLQRFPFLYFLQHFFFFFICAMGNGNGKLTGTPDRRVWRLERFISAKVVLFLFRQNPNDWVADKVATDLRILKWQKSLHPVILHISYKFPSLSSFSQPYILRNASTWKTKT